MKKIQVVLATESAEWRRLAADALTPESGITFVPFGGDTPDAAVFIGDSPHFFERRQPEIARLGQAGCPVICAGADPVLFPCGPFCEILPLPQRRDPHTLELFRRLLLIRVKSAYSRTGLAAPSPARPSSRVVGIGASTGGPQVLLSILSALPRDVCGILVVQHLTPGFSSRLAAYLDSLCALHVKQAADGALVEDGTVYLAEDGRHLTVARRAEGFFLCSASGAKINGFCPSADRLFESLATEAGASALGIVLTGMGADGAKGLGALRRAGGEVLTQQEASCAAPSMPRQAIKMAAAQPLAPGELPARILTFSGSSGLPGRWAGLPPELPVV